ncbi:MAG: phosphate/phosphite/phosphonate ABC transporter substrate-binding protein [Chloroflexota bacterium]
MPSFIRGALSVVFLAVAITSGCSRTDEEPKVPVETQRQQEQQKPFVIGLIPERQIYAQLERYQPLADYISQKIGRKVKLSILPRYGNIIDNFLSSGMDAAFFGSFTYALAHHKIGLEVLARPECPDGISTYYGLIFVRKDSGIRSARDMKGKVFAFVDKATTAGYLLPLAYFKAAGIKNYKRYLKETYFAGTHEDAIRDVLEKKADIGAAKNTVFDSRANTDARVRNELTILERSPDVPENALAVRKDLDSTIKNKLRDTLLNMHEDPEGRKVIETFGARKFIVTTDDDYAPVDIYAKDIGLDLATYDYMND